MPSKHTSFGICTNRFEARSVLLYFLSNYALLQLLSFFGYLERVSTPERGKEQTTMADKYFTFLRFLCTLCLSFFFLQLCKKHHKLSLTIKNNKHHKLSLTIKNNYTLEFGKIS